MLQHEEWLSACGIVFAFIMTPVLQRAYERQRKEYLRIWPYSYEPRVNAPYGLEHDASLCLGHQMLYLVFNWILIIIMFAIMPNIDYAPDLLHDNWIPHSINFLFYWHTGLGFTVLLALQPLRHHKLFRRLTKSWLG